MYFERVTIIGAGLLGASLGLALKSRKLAGTIVGIGHRQISLDAALEVGAVDETRLALTPEDAAASLVVICTPAAKVSSFLDEVAQHAGRETVITDVASTKAAIAKHADNIWAAPRPFAGSHPMAGSEKWGAEHASDSLYDGAVCFVESGATIAPAARTTIGDLWKALGCRVVDIEPADHDAMLAASSHLPHIVAAALAANLPKGEHIGAAIGPGFRDATRIADGRPELWRDICLTNREGILETLAGFGERLDDFRAALESADAAALDRFFDDARTARQRAVEG